jgi:glycogen phosphorylase
MCGKLQSEIVPMFYGRQSAYAEVMRLTIALNGSYFNTQRMLAQYALNAFAPQQTAAPQNS